MIEAQPYTNPSDPRVNRPRYLIDIILLVIASILLEIGITAIYRADNLQSQLVASVITELLLIAIAWLLIQLRGERLADIGLKSPESWSRAVLIGAVYATVVFVSIYLSEKAGIHRDLSRFKAVQGDVGITILGVAYSFIGAGFYEEFMFRGFLFQGLAMLLGGSRRAWIGACLVQGALFGAAHAYQSPTGIVITGILGTAMGFVFLMSGRNLWPVIVGHGLYDAGRFVLFYFQGPPA